jgi:tetratricopeptide (TPR) repeat protein
LARRRATLGPDDRDTLNSMSNLANSYAAVGRHEEALELRQEALDRRKATLGPDHRDTLTSMNNLTDSYSALGRDTEALRLREETLPRMKAQLGPDHPHTMAGMHNLADSYHGLGRDAEALKLYDQTLDLAIGKLGAKHANTLMVMNNLAWLLATAQDVRLRDHARAVDLATKTTQLFPKNPDFLGTLGAARFGNGDWKQAALDLERAIHLRGADDSGNVNESFFLAMCCWRMGDKSGARKWFDKGSGWMARNKSRTDEVRRFAVEAAKLLGVE